MQQATTTAAAPPRDLTGRAASRARREALSQGKSALPPPAERTRIGERAAAVVPVTATPSAPPVSVPQTTSGSAEPAAAASADAGLAGRALSMARRRRLSQGKDALKRWQGAAAPSAAPIHETRSEPPASPCADGSCRHTARARRAERARNGRGDAPPARPSGRVRPRQPLTYPPKVADSLTYERHKVTGVRIGRGTNVTGDEPGAALPVTGTQYIGLETGYLPRPGGAKVGASRTTGGLVVTGTQVRSQVRITGDESNPTIRITGEADQEAADDLLERGEAAVCAGAQFQRQHDPHGHTVFGTNLGRSARSVGSRERARERALEQTDGGLPISGTAVGRSPRVTGDEPGSCRAVTGDQYLMPASRQPSCEAPGARPGARRGGIATMNGRADPVTGEKVTVSESWTRQRITGVEVEHNPRVTGDEPGACAPITGTPYVGPAQYEAYCETEDASAAERKVAPPYATGNRVTGDTPANLERVTGTQRGAERAITGTPYYRAGVEEDAEVNAIERVNRRFSVRSPQREAQRRAGAEAVEAPSAESRITGSFAVGEGKITGSQEFHFRPRPRDERAARTRVTGEGRVEGPPVTGSAWVENPKVTGTEDYVAAERNPSERAGRRHAFASAGLFKGKGRHDEPRQIVTGMVGWSAKSAAKVTLSGGAQG